MDIINNAFPLCEISPLDNKDNLVEFIQRIFVKEKEEAKFARFQGFFLKFKFLKIITSRQ
jgi:hypothetical protein